MRRAASTHPTPSPYGDYRRTGMSPDCRRRWRPQARHRSTACGSEAVAAVDGLVTAGLEGHTRDAAAPGAGHLVHLAWAARARAVAAAAAPAAAVAAPTTTAAAAATAVGRAPCRAARGAPRRGIGQTARGKELLLSLGPNEVNAALAATQ